MKGWERFNSLVTSFLNIIYLNILWVVFSLLGGVAFGAFPAFSALFAMTRKKMILKESSDKLFVCFWKYYRKDFFKLNLYALIFYLIGYILYLNGMYLLVNAADFYFLVPGLLVILMIYLMTILFFFPVFVHYKLSFFQYLKQSFFIAVVSPLELLGALFVVVFLSGAIIWIPGVILFFTGSFFGISLTYLAHNAINKANKRLEKT